MANLVIRKQKHNSYAAGFKVISISFEEESNNCTASCQFEADEKLICDWRKNKAKLENVPKSKKALWYRKLPFLKLENVLHDWIEQCWQDSFIVTRTGICLGVIKLAKKEKYGVLNTIHTSEH